MNSTYNLSNCPIHIIITWRIQFFFFLSFFSCYSTCRLKFLRMIWALKIFSGLKHWIMLSTILQHLLKFFVFRWEVLNIQIFSIILMPIVEHLVIPEWSPWPCTGIKKKSQISLTLTTSLLQVTALSSRNLTKALLELSNSYWKMDPLKLYFSALEEVIHWTSF